MNENITKAGEATQQLRSALLGALSTADPVTCIILMELLESSAAIEKKLARLDAALVEAGRDDE